MKRLLFFIIAAILPLGAIAQKDYSKLLDKYVQAYDDVHSFSGNILIAKKGKVIYQKSLGQASREWGMPNAPDTKFMICSLTKQFTAAAILQLEERGKLSTNDKLNKYFPDFPNAEKITLHMLLNHTSGLKTDRGEPDVFKINPNIPIEELKETLINSFKDEPLQFEPGAYWSYSNSGYILLGYIIEQASGETYGSYIQKNILQKAGMASSGMISQDAIIPHFASGYNYTLENGWKKAKTFPLNVGFSAGNLYSTTGDLMKWNDALSKGTIISKESFDKMHLPNHGDFGAGYGIYVDRFFGHKAYHHQGAIEGFNTYMARYPEDEIYVIVLTNKDTNLDFLPKAIAAILFDKEVALPQKRMPQAIDAKTLPQYAGTYEGEGIPFPLTIVAKDSKLFLQLGRDIELVQHSANKFYINEPDVEMQLEFIPNGNKEMAAVHFIEAGVKIEAKRKG